MAAKHGNFKTSFGFLMAAAGSAVGLGNIWGFPSNAAQNGGALFLFIYLILAFLLAYPVLVAEITIGRYSKKSMPDTLASLTDIKYLSIVGRCIGHSSIIVAILINGFYMIVAGWMLAYLFIPFMQFFSMPDAEIFLSSQSVSRDAGFAVIFVIISSAVIYQGVDKGIERASSVLMPLLLILLLGLTVYVLCQDGAVKGVALYLYPNELHFSAALILNALGQAFFSLSLGVGVMLIYGSYLNSDANLPKLAAQVTLIDVSVAFLAGLLIIPAMTVAESHGLLIHDTEGLLLAGPDLIFQVLPALFDTMGWGGAIVSVIFFLLMVVAALTSAFSILEVVTVYFIDTLSISRHQAGLLTAIINSLVSIIIAAYFTELFDLTVFFSTSLMQPLLGLMICIYCGWLWHRDTCLQSLAEGYPELRSSLFWKVWPFYLRFICPLLIISCFFYN